MSRHILPTFLVLMLSSLALCQSIDFEYINKVLKEGRSLSIGGEAIAIAGSSTHGKGGEAFGIGGNA